MGSDVGVLIAGLLGISLFGWAIFGVIYGWIAFGAAMSQMD